MSIKHMSAVFCWYAYVCKIWSKYILRFKNYEHFHWRLTDGGTDGQPDGQTQWLYYSARIRIEQCTYATQSHALFCTSLIDDNDVWLLTRHGLVFPSMCSFSLAFTKRHGAAMPIVQTSSRDPERVNAILREVCHKMMSLCLEIINILTWLDVVIGNCKKK